MNRDHTLTRWLPRLALSACGALVASALPAMAQVREPAAKLLPARPVIVPNVVRGSTPDASLPSFTGAYVPSVPAPNYGGAIRTADSSAPKQSWAEARWAGFKETVIGKPNPQDPKSPEPDPRLLAPATSPLFGGTAAAAQPQSQPQPAPPGVYASPPAYRWYGWGTTTPGANPHSPNGVYPQGSANWYAQTGATPGAFPLNPNTPAAQAPAADPPVYASSRAAVEPPFSAPAPSPAIAPEPKPRFISGPPIPEPRVVARTPFQSPSAPDRPGSPTVPSGTPVAIASSGEGGVMSSDPVAVPQAELNWQTASGRGIPIVKEPALMVQPSLQPTPTVEPAWSPVSVPPPAKPNIPTISVIRGQSEGREPQPLEKLIRSACVGRVVRTDVRSTAPGKLTITFVAATESAAREAAVLVARLPELKPYEISFEARIVPH